MVPVLEGVGTVHVLHFRDEDYNTGKPSQFGGETIVWVRDNDKRRFILGAAWCINTDEMRDFFSKKEGRRRATARIEEAMKAESNALSQVPEGVMFFTAPEIADYMRSSMGFLNRSSFERLLQDLKPEDITNAAVEEFIRGILGDLVLDKAALTRRKVAPTFAYRMRRALMRTMPEAFVTKDFDPVDIE